MKKKKVYKTPHLGAAIRQLRKAKGWTQEDLAEVAQYSAPTINHIEQGISSPKYDTLENIAKALDTPIEELAKLGRQLKMSEKLHLRYIYAKNLKRIRLEKGLSQNDLANRAGVSITHIWKMENAKNNAGLDNIEIIARALEIAPYKLIKDFT